MKTPVIGLTAGDPAGVGPELLAAALRHCPKGVVLECIGNTSSLDSGKPSREGSLSALTALEEAARRAISGELAAVVTGPVSKKHLHTAGFSFPGQTEFFAARARVEDFAMLLTGGPLTVALVTAHVPLREVASMLTTSEIVRVGTLLADFLRRRGIAAPRIAVAGLNPHAGEEGDLGDEEVRLIAPAIPQLTLANPGVSFTGPFSPDTVFWRASHGEFDAVLCMYHDQGLIPLKLLGFHDGVNVTLGLPFVRTSPDHGTAYEIAGTGKARPDSFLSAIRLAADLITGAAS
ncbi:MAG: 4-hydroxythreonine-4-phosphate dehydrogenase PdxA [Proteobacteria bacterium]|jgi:4-hydroxythreonine-4-phosphate dehydrogenase|nr:4-hydroxythreonine-4-phosphate dehydrogenase PdxA [Pseudomonadota bacterium]